MNINYISGLVYGAIATAVVGFVLGRMKSASGTIKIKKQAFRYLPRCHSAKINSREHCLEKHTGHVGMDFLAYYLDRCHHFSGFNCSK